MSLRLLELLLCELDAALVSLLPSWGLPGCKGEDGPISSFLSFLLPSQMVVLLTAVRKLHHPTLPISPEVYLALQTLFDLQSLFTPESPSVSHLSWLKSDPMGGGFPAVNLNLSFRAQST